MLQEMMIPFLWSLRLYDTRGSMVFRIDDGEDELSLVGILG